MIQKEYGVMMNQEWPLAGKVRSIGYGNDEVAYGIARVGATVHWHLRL